MKRIALLLTIMTALLVCKTVFSDNSNNAPDSWTMGKAVQYLSVHLYDFMEKMQKMATLGFLLNAPKVIGLD